MEYIRYELIQLFYNNEWNTKETTIRQYGMEYHLEALAMAEEGLLNFGENYYGDSFLYVPHENKLQMILAMRKHNFDDENQNISLRKEEEHE